MAKGISFGGRGDRMAEGKTGRNNENTMDLIFASRKKEKDREGKEITAVKITDNSLLRLNYLYLFITI